MVDKNSMIDYVSDITDSLSDELYSEINKPIHDNPECCFEEYKAHELLTSYFAKQPGWEVTKSAYGIETLFIAVFTNKSSTPVVSFNAEYDALPKIGHACGHNLIATSSVSLALVTLKLMQKFDISGTVKLIGTPAEEGGGGKVKLLNAGLYKDCDVSIMAHPGNIWPGSAWGHTSANDMFVCEFFGKLAHLLLNPWDGINALDAQVIYYNCVSVLRQQLKPGDIVQGNILEGGASPNVISNYTKNNITVRATSRKRLVEVKLKVINCIKAACLATGCTYKLTDKMAYYDMISNDPMCDVFRKYFNDFCSKDGLPIMKPLETEHINGNIGASSDQGNVSYLLPSIQPMFAIDSPVGNHNEHFTKLAATKLAHTKTLKIAKCLTLTGLEVLRDQDLLQKIKTLWEKDMEINDPNK